MTGTIINVLAILLGGAFGLAGFKQFSPANQLFVKIVLGAFTVFFGLRLTWASVNGSLGQVLKQLLIVLLALMLGNLTGKLLRLQKASNRLGQYASQRFSQARPDDPNRFSEGFTACAILFCLTPLSLLGALQDGLLTPGYWPTLAIKAVMDGMAMMTFAGVFGWGSLLAAVPVLVFQGTITLATVQYLEPFLRERSLVDPVNATGGMLVFCVAIIILELKKVELADYLPSLAFAPLLAWIWR